MTKTALILAAIVATSSSAAFAQPAESVRTARVSYADLDLSREAGRATLEARITRTVSRLCAMPSGSDLDAAVRHRACRRAAWSGVRPQLAEIYGGARYAERASAEVATRVR